MLVLGVALLADIPRTPTLEFTVDYFELNHVHDDHGKCYVDQVILWEWADYYYYDEDAKRTKSRREPKVTDWYLVSEYRDKLTPEEQQKKNKELADAFVKKFGKGADNAEPHYNPPFRGGILVPRYDVARKKWIVVIVKDTHILKIYATTFVESWTQFDVEVNNQQLFSTDTRKHYLKRKYNDPRRHKQVGEISGNADR